MIVKKGKIVQIKKYQNRGVYLKQGVQGKNQYKYRNYSGGNGTYVIEGESSGTSLNVRIYVYDLGKCYTVNVYDDIKKITGKTRISGKMMETIENHCGENVLVTIDKYNNRATFDPSVLLENLE